MNRPYSGESNRSPDGLPFSRDRGKGLGDGGPPRKRDGGSRISSIDRVAAALSVMVPLGFALVQVPPTSPFQGDLPLLRGLGLVGSVGAGGVTTLLVQLATLIPMGPLAFRAGFVAAVALGISGLVIFALAKRLLLANLPTPRLAPMLAAMASLTVTLSPMLLGQATVAGGATVALALSASALLARARDASDLRSFLLGGAALGATLIENAPLGALVLVALLASGLVSLPRPPRKHLVGFVLALATTAGVLLLPWLLRPLSPRGAWDLGRTLSSIDLVIADSSLSRTPGLASWSSEIGKLPLALALLGLALGLFRHRLRALVLPLFVVALADALLPLGTRALISGDPLAPLSALSLSAIAVVAAVGFQTAAMTLLSTRTQAGAAAAVLLVMFDLTLVAMVAEGATLKAPSRSARFAESWTGEALDELPARSVLLVRSRAMAWRLFAARLEEGARKDVLIVPAALLSEGRVAKALLETEPALAPLLRDLSIHGRPSEASLTAVADARPVLVELDPSWDHRLASHLVAERLWLRFAPQPLGRSDRERAFEGARRSFEKVQSAAGDDGEIDPAAAAILAAQLRGHAASAGIMGDRDAAFSLLSRLQELSPDDPFVTELSHRLGASKGGVALEGLLR